MIRCSIAAAPDGGTSPRIADWAAIEVATSVETALDGLTAVLAAFGEGELAASEAALLAGLPGPVVWIEGVPIVGAVARRGG
jgi:hypothetical protein